MSPSGARAGKARRAAPLAVLLAALLLAPCTVAAAGDPLRIACASNFYPTLKRLAEVFNRHHPALTLDLISGSSGSLYQQLRHGAPYHLFLSADSAYPAALHRDNGSGAPRTYALGKLALWNPRGLILNHPRRHTVAIANPATAPYGRAAEAVIARYRRGQPAPRWRTVVAANVSQATQLVDSGNADLGLVALSLIQQRHGEYTVVPADWYQPLVQQAVVVDTGNPRARSFMAFLLSPRAARVIRADGYGLPGESHVLAR